MAAEVLSAQGIQVDLYDRMPSVGRKFLLAGRGGLNLTHSEALPRFVSRFGEREAQLAPLIEAFTPEALRDWAQGLGVSTFVGSSGRVFPTDMKAAPLLRAWLHRLRDAGVRFHMRHQWLGWDDAGGMRFHTPSGEITVAPRATVLALGGGSWSRLGSDGSWWPWLQARGVDVVPLQAANCGFDVAATGPDRTGWSDFLRQKFAGQPIKPVALQFTDRNGRTLRQQGEFVLTATGVEGSLIYAFSAAIRDQIAAHGSATVHLDLLPSHTPEQVLTETSRPKGPRSLSTHLKSRLGIQGLKMALLHEVLSPAQLNDPDSTGAGAQSPADHTESAPPHRRGHQHRRRRALRRHERAVDAQQPDRRVLRRRDAGLGSPHRGLSADGIDGDGSAGGAWRDRVSVGVVQLLHGRQCAPVKPAGLRKRSARPRCHPARPERLRPLPGPRRSGWRHPRGSLRDNPAWPTAR
jgi:uncharacterized flavoprotein (TIGR03862 family)